MDQTTGKKKRPELLKLLCILTFAGSGLSLISYTLMFFYQDAFREIVSSDQFGFFQQESEQNMMIDILSLPGSYFFLHALCYGLSLLGAWMMWNLRKPGFHFYATSQISLLIIYKAYIPSAPFPFLPLAVTVIFILLYFRNLKYMH